MASSLHEIIEPSSDFNPELIANARSLVESNQKYPCASPNQPKTGTVLLSVYKEHARVLVVPRPQFESLFSEFSLNIGDRLPQISNKTLQYPDVTKLSQLYHVYLANDKHYTLGWEAFCSVQKWVFLVSQKAWLVGHTGLTCDELQTLALMVVIDELKGKYKLTRADCLELAKRFGERVAKFENGKEIGKELDSITVLDGDILPLAELSSRNVEITGETAASGYATSRFSRMSSSFQNPKYYYANEFDCSKVQDYYFYYRLRRGGTILGHMEVAFSADGCRAIAIHLVKQSGKNKIFKIEDRVIQKDKLQKFHKITWYHVRCDANSLLRQVEKVWSKFGSYRLLRNNCQTFAKEFLHILGVGFWFSGVHDGFSPGKRFFIWFPVVAIGSTILSYGFGVSFYLLLQFIGLETVGAYFGLIFGFSILPLTYILVEDREFSTDSRIKLFTEAEKNGIQVIDDRGKVQKLFHKIMGW